MLRSLARLLPPGLRASCGQGAAEGSGALALAALRQFRAVADVEINFDDRETLKKYVGVRDHLSREPGTKARLMQCLHELADAAKALPAESDYRRALEATAAYRLKVCEANAQESAIEDVLDAHMEEVIQECFDEMKLIPFMAGEAGGAGGRQERPRPHAPAHRMRPPRPPALLLLACAHAASQLCQPSMRPFPALSRAENKPWDVPASYNVGRGSRAKRLGTGSCALGPCGRGVAGPSTCLRRHACSLEAPICRATRHAPLPRARTPRCSRRSLCLTSTRVQST